MAMQATGRTALFFAAENGHDAATSILVAHGADPNQQDVVKSVATEQRANPEILLGWSREMVTKLLVYKARDGWLAMADSVLVITYYSHSGERISEGGGVTSRIPNQPLAWIHCCAMNIMYCNAGW